MSEVALRLLFAAVAGATIRMLIATHVVPLLAGLVLLGLLGGVLSWHLDKSRILVVSLMAAGYFLTNRVVQTEPVVVKDLGLSLIWALATNFSLPFALPALGSIIGAQLEKNRQASDKELNLTEEALLAEKIDLTPAPRDPYDELEIPVDPKIG
ncbi:MAG: hypothetical protein NZV14_04320 [Bryobacteraceae bacterium]|nr:hypothetical protein [Bryobacteraceae bacterium]MDW8377358.1 hypothetical protein [Bryobacterales bacterium]